MEDNNNLARVAEASEAVEIIIIMFNNRIEVIVVVIGYLDSKIIIWDNSEEILKEADSVSNSSSSSGHKVKVAMEWVFNYKINNGEVNSSNLGSSNNSNISQEVQDLSDNPDLRTLNINSNSHTNKTSNMVLIIQVVVVVGDTENQDHKQGIKIKIRIRVVHN